MQTQIELLKTLPIQVQENIKSTLYAYSECTLELNKQGEYKVLTCVVLHNGEYNQIVGKFTGDGIFSQDEKIINYVTTFRDYPTYYKGKRNYKELNKNWSMVRLEKDNIILS